MDGEPWKEVQRERARRDYKVAVSDEGTYDRQFMWEKAYEKSISLSSGILEPGYWQEVMDLLKEDEDAENLIEYRDRYIEKKN
jgi:hypothetical protein